MKLKNEQQVQEEEYIFPYHYSSILTKHRGIPYKFIGIEIKKEISKFKINSLADVGCGDGFLLYNLKKNNNNIKKLFGYDYSENALRFAKTFNPKLEFKKNDIIKDKLPKKVDFIILQDMIEHLEPKYLKFVFKNLSDSLNKNGKILITVPTTKIPVSKKHFQHFTLEKIKKLTKNEFEYISHKYLTKISKIHNFNYNFLLWLCYSTYPFSATKLKFIYNILNKITHKYYSKNINLANKNNGSRILIILKKKIKYLKFIYKF